MGSGRVLLQVQGLQVAYGGIKAVKGVSFEVRQGELVSLIGANGAGKTTTLKAITGLQVVADGDIQFMGRSIKGQGAWDLARQGLVMVPEGRGTFTRMTITENLQMGAFIRNDKAQIEADIDKVFGIFPRLKERRKQLAGTMSGGEQQMLAVARILRTGAKLLLLDEISEGLAPVIVQKLAAMILDLKQKGFTIVLVEQNFRFAAPLADRFYVMEHGQMVQEFPQSELASKMELLHEFLGV
jgi:branched-chain amino acid transport system ATP-binding protein